MNAEEQINSQSSNNENSYSYFPFAGSPFHVVSSNSCFFLCMGQQIITPTFQTREQLDDYVSTNSFNIIFTMCCTIFERLKETNLSDVDK